MIAALVVVGVVHAARWAFLCDDAYISFRYAHNLATHGELAFNVAPLERVEGYTNFLWVLLLGLGAAIGIAPERAALPLGFAAYVAVLLLVVALVRQHVEASGRARWAAVPAVAWLAASPEAVVWASSGLETGFAAALVLGAMVAWAGGRPRTAAGLGAAAILARPDGAVVLAAWGLGWLLVHGRAWWRGPKRPSARRLLETVALFVVPLALHLLWRRAYYGAWLPNTWAVKAHGAALRDTWGVAYVQAWATAMWLPWLAPALLLLRGRAVPLLAAIVATLAYGWSVGGDFMAYSRFFVVATASFAVVLAVALDAAAARIDALAPRATLAPVLLGVLGAAALGVVAQRRHGVDRGKPEGWIDGKWEGVTAMARFAEVGRAAGAWMHEHLPADTLITVGAAGAVPYASDLPTIDAFGLVDPTLARLDPPPLREGASVRPGHQLFAPPEYIRGRDPDLLCHVGFRGAHPPREADARPPFRAGHVWACVRPGPGSARVLGGVAFDPGVYCCRRPRERVVGPFGTPLEDRRD